MRLNLLDKLNKSLLYIFVSVWSIFLFADYYVHEKFICKAFNNITFSAILPVLFIIFISFLYWLKKKGTPISMSKHTLENVTGWKLLILFLVSTLAYVTTYASFIKAFENSTTASLTNYITLVLPLLFYIALLILPCFVIGSFALDFFPSKIENKQSRLFISLALGFALLGILLFLLASAYILTQGSVMVLCISICGIGYKRFLALGKEIFTEKYVLKDLNWLGALSFFILLVFIVINFNSSLRPIPIGFDELSLYMNTPKLIAGYHGLVQGGQAYQWSIWMSLGFILHDSVALSTLISILPGVLSCYVLYRIARVFCDTNFSLLAAVIFYCIPTTIWQSSADAKVDLALVFFVLSGVLLLLESNKKTIGKIVDSPIFNQSFVQFFQSNVWMNIAILLGILLGYSFGIKYTAIFFIIALVAGFMYQYSQSLSLASSITAIGIAFIFLSRLYTFSGIEFESDAQVHLIGFVFILLFLTLSIFHFVKYKLKFVKGYLYGALIGMMVLLTFSPWLSKHYGENKMFSADALLNGKTALDSPEKILNFEQTSSLFHVSTNAQILYTDAAGTSDGRIDSLINYYSNVDKGTGKYEEVIRYIGYEKGIPKYLSILHDLGTFQNVANLPTDIGLFLFVLFPLIFLSLRPKQLYSNAFNIVLLIVILLVAFSAISISNGIIDDNSFKSMIDKMKIANPDYNHTLMGIYMFFAHLLHSFILMLKPFILGLYKTNTAYGFIYLLGIIMATTIINSKTILSWNHAAKTIFIMGGSSSIIWWFFGSGISWYALPAFAIVIPLLVYVLSEKEIGLLSDSVLRIPIYFILISGLVISLLFRQESMMVTYSYDPKTPSNTKINQLFLQYSHGEHTADECLEIVNKTIANTAQALNTGENEKIIRIGTSMNYFIDNNDKRVYEDNQLDLFNKVYTKWYGTKDLISNNFTKNNIRYLLFDFATGNLDNTPDKSLTKKVANFYDYISSNPRVEVVNTDRLVEDPNSKESIVENGRQVPASYSIFGTRVIQPGTLLLIRIKD